jgi:hypothetical protein
MAAFIETKTERYARRTKRAVDARQHAIRADIPAVRDELMLLATTLAWMADADIRFTPVFPEPAKGEPCLNQIQSLNVSVRGAESRLTARFNHSESSKLHSAPADKLL